MTNYTLPWLPCQAKKTYLFRDDQVNRPLLFDDHELAPEDLVDDLDKLFRIQGLKTVQVPVDLLRLFVILLTLRGHTILLLFEDTMKQDNGYLPIVSTNGFRIFMKTMVQALCLELFGRPFGPLIF